VGELCDILQINNSESTHVTVNGISRNAGAVTYTQLISHWPFGITMRRTLERTYWPSVL